MAATDKVTDKRGMKRICVDCGTRFYDFNKRPVICPDCDVEFTGKAKVKARRGRVAAANKDEGQVQKVTKAEEKSVEEDDETDSEAEDMALSLDDDDTSSKSDDDNSLGNLDMGSNDDEDDDLDDGDDNKSLEDELEEEGPDGAVTDEDDEDKT